MLKKFTQTDRHGNMMSKEMMGKFLKKKVIKDRHGNQMAFEFDIPESNVPPVNQVPQYSAEGGDIDNHPGGPKGSDTVPAWLTPGEFVVNKEATDLFGDTIKQMNEIGRQIQDQRGAEPDGLMQVPNHVYANKGQAIKELEENPLWTAQLNHMLEKYKGSYFNKERLYSMMAGESSISDPGEKNTKGSASGLFQFTETPLKDMRRKGLVPKDFTTDDIRDMDPHEQLELYEKYLDMWGYQGNVHLGIMQAAPGAYHEAKDDSGWVDINKLAYEKDSEGWHDNAPWRGKDGNITFKSISDYYDKQGDNQDLKNVFAELKEKGLSVPYGISPSDQNQITPASYTTSGAQNIAGVPPVNLPIDTASNIQPDPGASLFIGNTDHVSGNIPNYAAHIPMGSNAPKMAVMEPIAGPSSGRIAEVMGNLQPSPDVNVVPGNNQNVTLDIAQIPGVNPMMDINNPMGKPVPVRVIDGKQVALTPEYLDSLQDNDFGGVGSDSSMYKLDQSAQPMTYPQSQLDADRMMEINVPPVSDITSTGNWPPSANTSEYNFGRPSEASIAKAEMDEKVKQQQYMDNFSPPELEKYIPEYSKPSEEFDYRAAQENQMKRQHDFLNMKEWDDFGKVSNTLVEEYGKGVINEEEYKKKLEFAEQIKKNKENKVLDQWERKANNQKINEKLQREKELRDLRKRLDGTVDPKLKAAVQELINKKEEEVKKLDDSIVKNVDKSGWSTDIESKEKVEVDDPNVFKPTKEAIENLTTTVNKTNGEDKPGGDQEGNVKTTGESQPPAEKKKAESFLKGLFGNLFNKQELARAAVMYLGSRAMGYGHGGSLNFAVKNYTGRVDAKEAAAMKYATSAAATKKWTAKSLADYAKSGDLSDLKPLPTQLIKTKNTKIFYGTKDGKDFKIPVTEYKTGPGDGASSVWLDRSGKEHDERNYTMLPMYNKHSKEHVEAMDKYSETYADIMTKLRTVAGQTKDNKNFYHTDIKPQGDAGVVAAWALRHQLPLHQMRGMIETALRDAEEDGKRGKYKATSLVPYLNSLAIRQKVPGINMDLLRLEPKTKMEKDRGYGAPVDARDFERLRDNAIKWIQITEPEAIKGKSLMDIQLAAFAELTDGWASIGPEKQKEWNRKASKTTTGFMEWSKQSINNVMSGMD